MLQPSDLYQKDTVRGQDRSVIVPLDLAFSDFCHYLGALPSRGHIADLPPKLFRRADASRAALICLMRVDIDEVFRDQAAGTRRDPRTEVYLPEGSSK